jgi:hypothetical protein
MTMSGTMPYSPRSRAEGEVRRQDRRLGNGGLLQRLLGRGDRPGVLRVEEDVGADGPAEDRLHLPVGLCERLGDDRLEVAEGAGHVHVLRALAREEEGDLRGGAAPAENALAPERAPGSGLSARERLERLLDLLGELLRRAEVDGDALGGPEVARARRGHGGGSALARLGLKSAEGRREGRRVGGADEGGAPERRLRLEPRTHAASRGRRPAPAGSPSSASRGRAPRGRRESSSRRSRTRRGPPGECRRPASPTP